MSDTARTDGDQPLDRSERILRASLYVTVTLTGGLGIVLGAHDVVVASGTNQLFGIALLLLGLASVSAAFGWSARTVMSVDLDFLRWAAPAGSASIAALMFGIQMFNLRLYAASDLRFGVVLGVAFLALAASLVALFRFGRVIVANRFGRVSREFRLPKGRLRKAVSVVASVSVLGGASNFLYTKYYLPFDVKPTISVSTKLDSATAQAAGFAVTGTVNVKNGGESRLVVLGSQYRLTGEARSIAPSQISGEDRSKLELGALQGKGPTHYYNGPTQKQPELLEIGRVLPLDFRFDRGQEYQMTFVAFFPEKMFNLVRLYAAVQVTKETSVQFDEPKLQTVTEDLGDRQGYIIRDISRTSWVQLFTAPQGFIREWWRLDEPDPNLGIVPLRVEIGKKGTPNTFDPHPKDLTQDLSHVYGFGSSEASTELSLGMHAASP